MKAPGNVRATMRLNSRYAEIPSQTLLSEEPPLKQMTKANEDGKEVVVFEFRYDFANSRLADGFLRTSCWFSPESDFLLLLSNSTIILFCTEIFFSIPVLIFEYVLKSIINVCETAKRWIKCAFPFNYKIKNHPSFVFHSSTPLLNVEPRVRAQRTYVWGDLTLGSGEDTAQR